MRSKRSMASVTDTTRSDPAPPHTESPNAARAARRARARAAQREGRKRGLFSSSITRLIFVCNFLGLLVLFIGVLLLSETRTRLTQAQYQSLQQRGELMASIIVASASYEGETAPQLFEPMVREVLKQMLPPLPAGPRGALENGPRIRVYSPTGRKIADSDVIYSRIDEGRAPPIDRSAWARFTRSAADFTQNVEYLRLTPWRPSITLDGAREAALQGEAAQGQRVNERGERVVMVSLPLQRVEAVLGFITLESADVERILVAERLALAPFVIAAAVVTILASTLLALFIANPLRKLSSAADRLRVTGATRLKLPDLASRKDDIGDLAASLERMTGALAERIDLNERFAADVSHEIKNPLASIRSAVESIRAVKDPEQQGRLLQIVATDANRLDRLISDIARATRLDAETARSQFERLDLARLAFDIASAYDTADDDDTDGARVSVRFDTPVTADAMVLGQIGPLGQVLRNLIDNAISFSPPGGVVRVSVSVHHKSDGALAAVRIEDQGPGIPPANLETIFARFYTERPKGAAFGGNSGLGLSIARQIVEAHRGRIWAENIPRSEGGVAGARLVVELPVAPLSRT
ncbi:MAG: HAMP domain-containing protein [Alphaproteobacteria bacterium]|nr:HAMP domain-containing protein [Alphaproteobacteria bacterium]